MPFYRSFFGEGSPTKIDYRKKKENKQKGTLILTSLLEDLGKESLAEQPSRELAVARRTASTARGCRRRARGAARGGVRLDGRNPFGKTK